MQRRFTIIQGGLSERPSVPAMARQPASGWHVVLRRPNAVGEAEEAAWRALAETVSAPDPFAHPDYMLTAAKHGSRGADIAFAFAYRQTLQTEDLSYVLPLVLPHPVWGASTVRLWQPAMAPRPVEPLGEAAYAPAVLEAVLGHLQEARPNASLRLGRIPAEGNLVETLAAASGLQVRIERNPTIPSSRFVSVASRVGEDDLERTDEPVLMRDAVERFLLLDAERSRRALIADPAESAIVRVVTRLFAKRGAARVELGRRGDALVSGAIRLGKPGQDVLWRSVERGEDQIGLLPSADIDVALAHGRSRDDLPRPRVVSS